MEQTGKGNYYESMFIVDVADGEETVKTTVAKFVGIINENAETVVEVAEWGRRRLAYPINDKPEGYYVVVTFKAAPDFPAEFERLALIDEHVMRAMVVRLNFVPVAKAAPSVPQAPAETGAGEAPAEEAAPAAEPAAEPAAAPVAEPAAEPVAEPVAEPAAEPVEAPAAEVPPAAGTAEETAPAEAPAKEAPSGETTADVEA